MSIRLDPRRVGVLKQLAAEANTRPGDLVRIWIEERLDAERRGDASASVAGLDVAARLAELSERVAALESAGKGAPSDAPSPEVNAEAAAAAEGTAEQSPNGDAPKRRGRNKVAATPSGERVALHDEIIAVLGERGPLPAGEIAVAIVERGRYLPPRSGKPLDAATVNARVSNPTYRGRFTRSGGRIGLVEG
jgi:hypothetical protein